MLCNYQRTDAAVMRQTGMMLPLLRKKASDGADRPDASAMRAGGSVLGSCPMILKDMRTMKAVNVLLCICPLDTHTEQVHPSSVQAQVGRSL